MDEMVWEKRERERMRERERELIWDQKYDGKFKKLF